MPSRLTGWLLPLCPAATKLFHAWPCRLRVSLSAAHSTADVAELVGALRDCGVQFQQLGPCQGGLAGGSGALPGRQGGGPQSKL